MMLLQAAIAVLLVHTVPWIASNTSPKLTVGHLKRVILEDIHFTPEYYEGDRLMSWGLMLNKLYGDVEEQRRCFKLRVSAKPDDQRAWIFYAWSCYDLGQYDNARSAAQNVRHPDRLTQGQLEDLADLHLRLGETGQAKQLLATMAEHHSESFDYLSLSGLAHQLERDDITASEYYRRALPLRPDDIDLLLNYAAVAMNTSDLALANTLLRTAGSLPNLSEKDRADIVNLRQTLSKLEGGAPDTSDVQ
jgi:tetratricopeptide (TPR) repeat protein